MAAVASLTDLLAEASCPLCLDFLRDPVTIDCGHNFCGSCIHQCWEDLQDIFPCPICLHHCPNGNFVRNTQLCHMTEIVTKFTTRRSKRKPQEENPLCEKHNQVLTLFCQEDLELLCAQCRVPSDHQNHQLMPLGQAAAHDRKKLKCTIRSLKKQVEDVRKGLDVQVSKSFELNLEVGDWSGELHTEFEQLKQLLEDEQDALCLGLMMEGKDVEEKLIENQMQISDHISTLKIMLVEMKGKAVQADLDLLTGVESIHKRYKNMKFPEIFSYELKQENCYLSPLYFGLKKMISIFKVDLTLDPETAHPNLFISDDRKSVTYRMMKPNISSNPKRFTAYPAVLGCEAFGADRHYWQVEIRGPGEWSIGVCRESLPRNANTSPSPKDGCWQIQHLTTTCGRWNTTRIGIFLDYELGEDSFYNWSNRSYIYTFTDTFTENLKPFFSTGSMSDTLTICIITDEMNSLED